MPRRLGTGWSLVALWAWFASATPAWAQSVGPPTLSYVEPSGATIGLATEWTLTGQNLGGVKSLLISGGGVEVVGLTIDPPVPGSQGQSARCRVVVTSDAAPGFREVRLDGPGGASNLAVVRLDPLLQFAEVEPNDRVDQSQEVEAGSVVVASLGPVDLDHYRVRGTPGQRLTIDLESRRIGSSFAPVVTVESPSGSSIAQGRELRGGDRDCRMGIIIPPEGWLTVQVRDNTYAGAGLGRYRLRIDPAPFATGLFPLGGPKGSTIEVELSGGNLLGPRRKRITLPDSAGSFVEVGAVDGPGGPAVAPGRLVVGDGPEMAEPVLAPVPADRAMTVNGRLARPGEVDVYKVAVKAGDRLRAKVEAAAMGSWLDSVVTIRDASGATLAENDDTLGAIGPNQARAVGALGIADGSTDSLVEFEAKVDGLLTVEVADRFGDGGPEYAYRLALGPSRPDFAVTLILGGTNGFQPGVARRALGASGVLNLRPGGSMPVNFVIAPEGRPGPIEVRFEALPEGVTADPVEVRFPGPLKPGEAARGPTNPAPASDFLLLKVAPHAQPGFEALRVVATARPSAGVEIVREATAAVGIDPEPMGNRPAIRVISRLPLRITGEARPQFVGPPAPPRLLKVTVPGPLLQGDRIDLGLEFDRAITADDGSTLEARAEGVGLAASTAISAGTTDSGDDGSGPGASARVSASAKAKPGPRLVRVSFTPKGGPTVTREVTVDVRPPIAVRPSPGPILLGPGDSAPLKVEIRREAGFDGEVDLRFEGLPRGVKPARGTAIAAGASAAEVVFEMAATAKPMARASEIRVVGIARLAGAAVAVEAEIRPMIGPRPAD